MNVNKELLPEQMVKLTIEVEAEKFNDALNRIYLENRGKCPVEGYATGEAPMEIIEEKYGADIFYRETANLVMSEVIMDAYEQAGVLPGSRPAVNVIQMGKNKPYIFEITFAMVPEVKLAEYKGLTYEKPVIEITDEDIAERIAELQEQNARVITIEDRAVKDGDIVVIDYIGFADGERFKGGSADDYPLEIGSHSFIDTFEDQLVGLNIGDKKDVEVTFPEEYHAEDLAGKPAVFHVEILGIKEKQLEEINDDFAQDHTEFDSLEEYKNDIREKLALGKEEVAKRNMEEAAIEQVIANATIDVPEAMIESEVDQMVQEFQQRITMQGLSFEQYLQFTGSDMNTLRDGMKEQAEQRVRVSLTLEEIAKVEEIVATDEDLNAEYEKMAAMYQMDAAQIASYMGEAEKENMKQNLAVQKALDFIVANAVVTEASEELEFEAE